MNNQLLKELEELLPGLNTMVKEKIVRWVEEREDVLIDALSLGKDKTLTSISHWGITQGPRGSDSITAWLYSCGTSNAYEYRVDKLSPNLSKTIPSNDNHHPNPECTCASGRCPRNLGSEPREELKTTL